MKIITVICALVFIMFSIVFSCKKDSTPNIFCSEKANSIEIVKKLLPGNYSWEHSIVTYPGSNSFTETPSSTGMNYKYVFDKSGTVFYYENNALKSADSYNVDYEFKVTTYPSDSATIIIITDKQNGQRKDFFRPYLCNDSALFYNPHSSIDYKRYFKRN